MTVLKTIRNAGRAAVLAVVLAGTAMTAMPVQAAPLNNFSLDVAPKSGGEDLKEFKQFKKKGFSPNDFFDWCLTDKQVRKGLKNYGFYDIDIVAHLSKNRIRVEAAYDEWYYSFRVNLCSGEVDKIKKLYPAWDDEDDFPF